MHCPKHPQEKMTLLFTSWACDKCSPVAGAATTGLTYVKPFDATTNWYKSIAFHPSMAIDFGYCISFARALTDQIRIFPSYIRYEEDLVRQANTNKVIGVTFGYVLGSPGVSRYIICQEEHPQSVIAEFNKGNKLPVYMARHYVSNYTYRHFKRTYGHLMEQD